MRAPKQLTPLGAIASGLSVGLVGTAFRPVPAGAPVRWWTPDRSASA